MRGKTLGNNGEKGVYVGPERRNMENTKLMMESIEKLFNEKFNFMKDRLDKLETDTKQDIESIRSSMENLFHNYDHRARTDLDEVKLDLSRVKNEVADLKEEIRNMKLAPMKKAGELKEKFFKDGKDFAIKAVWTFLFGFFAFLLMQYVGILK